MREITQEYLRELFAYDPVSGELTWLERPVEHFSSASYALRFKSRFSGKLAGNVGPLGYRRVNIANKFYTVHRLVWLMTHGEWPESIDHINGVRDDNRLANLRAVSAAENARNSRAPTNNTSGAVGVSWDKSIGKWFAYIGAGRGTRRALGFFAMKADAIAARKSAEREIGYHENHGRAA